MYLRHVSRFALALVMLAAFAVPAEAARARSDVRSVQEKLTLLGYDPGTIDGKIGRQTRAAIRAFQKDASLSADGVAGRKTLAALDEALDKGGINGQRPLAANNQLDIFEDVLTDRLGQTGSVTLPARFAKVELKRTNPGRYSISINGAVVATSPGANALPRISRTFELPGEDAFLFAATSANRKCRIENTLLVVRKDGSFMPPTPVGNCKEILNGRVQDDELVLSFPPMAVPDWRLEESWIYQGGQVVQK